MSEGTEEMPGNDVWDEDAAGDEAIEVKPGSSPSPRGAISGTVGLGAEL